MTKAKYDLMIIEEMIRVMIKTGSINPQRAKKFAIIFDLYQSFSHEAIVNKNMKMREMINGNGTMAVILGTHLSFASLSIYPSLSHALSEGMHPS